MPRDFSTDEERYSSLSFRLRSLAKKAIVASGAARMASHVFPGKGPSYRPGTWGSSPDSSMKLLVETSEPRGEAVWAALEHRRNKRVSFEPDAAIYFDFEILDKPLPTFPELFCILDQGLSGLTETRIRRIAAGKTKILYFRLTEKSEPTDKISFNLQAFDLRQGFTPEQQNAFIASRIEESLAFLVRRSDHVLSTVMDSNIVRPAIISVDSLPAASDVTFVIPTLNGGPEFESTLRSIRCQRIYSQSSVFLVDSGSQDGTVQLAQKYGAVVYPFDKKQFNHGTTRDFIIGKTTTPLVVLLVQDATLMDSESMANQLRHFSRPKVAGVYTASLPVKGHDEFAAREPLVHRTYLGPYSKTYSMPSRDVFERMNFAERQQMSRFDNVCSAIRRSVWEEIPFGHTAFGEDIGWCKNAQLKGHQIVYDPFARVFHSHMRPAEYTRKRYMTQTFHISAMLGTFLIDYSHISVSEMDWLSETISHDTRVFLTRCRALASRKGISVRRIREALREMHFEIKLSQTRTRHDWRQIRSQLLMVMGTMVYDKSPKTFVSLEHLEALARKAEAATVGDVWGEYLSSYSSVHQQLSPELQERLRVASQGV